MSAKIIPSMEQTATLRELVSIGKPRQAVADALGISSTTLATWIIGNEYPEIKEVYFEAKAVYANDLAESIMEQASAPLPDNPKLAAAEVQRRRLIVDTIKWVSCKLMPKIYGDNVTVSHGGKVEHEHEHKLSPLAQLRALEASTPPPKVIDVDNTTISEGDCF